MGVEMRIVLRNYNKIDNSKIDDYIDTGGYKACLYKPHNTSSFLLNFSYCLKNIATTETILYFSHNCIAIAYIS
jgi:hypothetical protein